MQIDMAQVYTDFEGLAALRAKARDDQHAALDQVARQFESLFLQMMLKSMRDASFGGGLLDSKQSEFYREMYDDQIAVDMTQKTGIGLAEVDEDEFDVRHHDGVLTLVAVAGQAARDLRPHPPVPAVVAAVLVVM